MLGRGVGWQKKEIGFCVGAVKLAKTLLTGVSSPFRQRVKRVTTVAVCIFVGLTFKNHNMWYVRPLNYCEIPTFIKFTCVWPLSA